MSVEITPLLIRRNADGTYSLDTAAVGGGVYNPLALQPGYSPVSPGSTDPKWFKDAAGLVHLTGYIFGPSGLPFQLPAGARPFPSSLHTVFFVDDATSTYQTEPVIVRNDGWLELIDGPGNHGLDSIHFKPA